MKSHLKIKVFSLSAEMTYIRRQEEKWKNRARYARQKQNAEKQRYAESNFWSQRWHRRDLKVEARTTHLAYGAMRNVPYSQMEYICHGETPGYNRTAPAWQSIEDMVTRFAKDEPNPQEIMQKFAEWLADAKQWYDGNPDRIEQFYAPEAVAHRRAVAKARKELAVARKKRQTAEAIGQVA